MDSESFEIIENPIKEGMSDQHVPNLTNKSNIAKSINESVLRRDIRDLEDNQNGKPTVVNSQPGASADTAPTPNSASLNVTPESAVEQANKNSSAVNKQGTPSSIPILTKMLLEPYAHLIPKTRSILLSPVQSSIVTQRGTEFSPRSGDFADPLLLYSLHGAVPTFTFDWESVQAPIENVQISTSAVRRAFVPSLTVLGEQLAMSLNASRTDQSVIRSLMAPPPLQEQCGLAILLKDTVTGGYAMYHEEAMPLRLLCLLQTMMPPQWYEAKTEVLLNQNFWSSGFRFETAQLTAYSGANDSLQIKDEDKASNLYIISQQDYIKMRAEQRKPWGDNPIIIPVYQSWLKQRWILAYILGFTTTRWWNHTKRYKWYTSDTRYETPVDGDKDKCLWLTAYPKGTTVFIDGDYKDIVLVTADTTGMKPVGGRGKIKYPFLMGETFDHATGVYSKMTTIFYNYIGRTTTATLTDRYEIDRSQIMRALSEFTTYLSNPAAMQRVYTYAAILLGTFTCGNLVSTKTRSGVYSGVSNYNIARTNAKNKIFAVATPDMYGTYDDKGKNHLTRWNFWRVNCLGMFCHSSAHIGDGTKYDTHRTQLMEIQNDVPMWSITEMDSHGRILMFSSVFENYSTRHSGWEHTNEYDLLNYIYAHSAMLGALTNWSLAELGITLFDANRMTTFYQRPSDKSFLNILSVITDGFFNTHSSFELSFVKSDDFKAMYTDLTGIPASKRMYDEYYGLFLPYWFVKGIIQKFQVAVQMSNLPVTETVLDTDDDDEIDGTEHQYYYHCGVSSATWADFNLMISTMNYETAFEFNTEQWFSILMPNRSWSTCKDSLMPWWPYARTSSQCNRVITSRGMKLQTATPVNAGVIESMMMVRPDSRVRWNGDRFPLVYVSPFCHQKRDSEHTWYKIRVDIPDPLWDWLTTGVIAVAPFLIKGDFYGAAVAGSLYLADTGYAWLSDYFRGQGEVEENIEEANLH